MAITRLRELGIEAEVERRDAQPGNAQKDAFIRIRHGNEGVLYAAEAKRGIRPALLGTVLMQLGRLL